MECPLLYNGWPWAKHKPDIYGAMYCACHTVSPFAIYIYTVYKVYTFSTDKSWCTDHTIHWTMPLVLIHNLDGCPKESGSQKALTISRTSWKPIMPNSIPSCGKRFWASWDQGLVQPPNNRNACRVEKTEANRQVAEHSHISPIISSIAPFVFRLPSCSLTKFTMLPYWFCQSRTEETFLRKQQGIS